MTNESPGPASAQGSSAAATPASSASSQPKSSRRWVWIIVAVVGLLCLCGLGVAALAGTGLLRVAEEKAPVESVLDAYMSHMANRDASSAYALFSPRAQRQVRLSENEDLLEGNNYYLFDGYRNLTVGGLNISIGPDPDPDVPQGIVAEVSGTINYEGGIVGTFDGVLEKVGDAWMIDSIFVSAPPNKIP